MEASEKVYAFPVRPVEEIKREILPMLIWLRDDFIVDIPAELIHSEGPGPKNLKCRSSWFNGVKNYLEEVAGQLKDPLLGEVIEFKHYLEHGFDWSILRTPEEIERADGILRKVIFYIETEM